jgi:hypothetical protein
MSQTETQLISSLQGFASTMKAIGQSVQRSWWETWGPPVVSGLITVAGWVVLVLLNKKNNQDLLERQTRELARNSILDALDEYKEFLSDVGFPRFAALRDIIADRTAPDMAMRADARQRSTLDPAIVRSKVIVLTMFDPREYRWRRVLNRDFWIYDGDYKVSNLARRMELTNEEIMIDLFQYEQELLEAIQESNEAAVAFVKQDRKQEAAKRIEDQREQVHTLYKMLNTPAFWQNARPRAKGTQSK